MAVTEIPGGWLAVDVPIGGLLEQTQRPEVWRHRWHVHRDEELFSQLEDRQWRVALERELSFNYVTFLNFIRTYPL